MKDIRQQFPILDSGYVYLDSAATSLTPEFVIDRINNHYRTCRSNVHRAQHPWAAAATAHYEQARDTVAKWLGTSRKNYEVIFTSGFTAAANLAAAVVDGLVDGVAIAQENHHSNILPWERLSTRCAEPTIVLTNTPLDNIPLISGRRLIAAQTIGNVLGEKLPIARICRSANEQGHWVFLDLAQSAAKMQHELDSWQPAFAAFSSHKIYGPTGSGALLVRRDVAEMIVNRGNRAPVGGGTVTAVDVNFIPTWTELPWLWEPGTPNLAGVEGMVAAIEWMQNIGIDTIAKHDQSITDYLVSALDSIPSVRIIGAGRKTGLVSFNVDNCQAEDIAQSLGAQQIAVRAGGLCANPLLTTVSTGSAVRASVAAYTTTEDIDKLVAALEKTISRVQKHAQRS